MSDELPDFTPTPPTPTEQAATEDDRQTLCRAANMLRDRVPQEGAVILRRAQKAELAAWLRAAAQEAPEIGADFRAVRFAKALLSEGNP